MPTCEHVFGPWADRHARVRSPPTRGDRSPEAPAAADADARDVATARPAAESGAAGSPSSFPWWVYAAVVLVAAVLRFGGLGAASVSVDESYTAFASDQSVGDLLAYIHDTDVHPPLSYLLTKPFLLAGDSSTWLRLFPALCSTLAVVAMALWQRREGVAGLAATVLLAVSPEQLLYGRQARMYGLMVLAGVVVAWAATRWSTEARRAWGVVAAVAATTGALSHSTGFILLAGLLLVPGLRRDREAWLLRAMTVVGILLTAVVFLPVALERSDTKTFYPETSVSWVTTTVNEMLAPVPSQRWIVLALLVAGGVLLVRKGGAAARVWLALFAAPLLGLVVVSFRAQILLPKSVLSLSWGVMVALGVVVGEAWRRRPVAGIAVAVLLGVLTLPYVAEARAHDEHAGDMVAALSPLVEDGDVVAVRPANLDTIVQWNLGQVESRELTEVDTPWPDTVAWRVGEAAPTGRTWLVESRDRADRLVEVEDACGPDHEYVGGGFVLSCVSDPAP